MNLQVLNYIKQQKQPKEEQKMADITQIDKNFAVDTEINKELLTFYDMEQPPFRIYGVSKENGYFRRIPEAVAKAVKEGV